MCRAANPPRRRDDRALLGRLRNRYRCPRENPQEREVTPVGQSSPNPAVIPCESWQAREMLQLTTSDVALQRTVSRDRQIRSPDRMASVGLGKNALLNYV